MFIFFLQIFVLQAQRFMHCHGSDQRKMRGSVRLTGENFQVLECPGKECVVVVAPPVVGVAGRGGGKVFKNGGKVVNALGCEVLVDAVEMEVARIIGAGVVARRFQKREKAVVVGHDTELEASGTACRADDGRYGTVAARGGGEAVAPIETCSSQRIYKGHGMRLHYLVAQRFDKDDDDIGRGGTGMEVGGKEGIGWRGAFQGVERVNGGAPFGMGSKELGDILPVVFNCVAVFLIETRLVDIHAAVFDQIQGFVEDILTISVLYQMRHLEYEREHYQQPDHCRHRPHGTRGMIGPPQGEDCKSSCHNHHYHNG